MKFQTDYLVNENNGVQLCQSRKIGHFPINWCGSSINESMPYLESKQISNLIDNT